MGHRGPSGGTVLITGASSGIGQAAARLFAEHHFRVFGTSRHDRPDQPGVEMLRLDVRSDESVARCVQEVSDKAEGIDLLINNAGVMHEGFAEETTLADAEGIFATNLFGVARVTNAVLPGMRHRRKGRIINVGSLAAWVGEPGEAFYAASKAALARYTESLRHEVAHLGIAVCIVEPGAFATNVLGASSISEPTIADYDELREPVHRTLDESLDKGGDPAVAAALMLRIAQARSPLPRYGVGRGGRFIPCLTVLAPQRLVEYLLRRGFGFPAPAGARTPGREAQP